MAFVYIDLIKIAVPAGMRNREPHVGAQYVVFGAYDLLHYALPNPGEALGLSWLEQQHEDRHHLDWNCERHPVFLSSADEDLEHVRELLEPASYRDRPLVLTMASLGCGWQRL